MRSSVVLTHIKYKTTKLCTLLQVVILTNVSFIYMLSYLLYYCNCITYMHGYSINKYTLYTGMFMLLYTITMPPCMLQYVGIPQISHFN